jgi:hypothetical protein
MTNCHASDFLGQSLNSTGLRLAPAGNIHGGTIRGSGANGDELIA